MRKSKRAPRLTVIRASALRATEYRFAQATKTRSLRDITGARIRIASLAAIIRSKASA